MDNTITKNIGRIFFIYIYVTVNKRNKGLHGIPTNFDEFM